MGRLVVLAVLGLLTVACSSSTRSVITHTVEPLRFIQPRARIANSTLAGVDISVQLWVESDPENRALAVYWNGVGCYGSTVWQLDGEYEAEVQPPLAPYKIRMTPGVCTIVADLFGPGNKLLRRATFDMHICGGENPCGSAR